MERDDPLLHHASTKRAREDDLNHDLPKKTRQQQRTTVAQRPSQSPHNGAPAAQPDHGPSTADQVKAADEDDDADSTDETWRPPSLWRSSGRYHRTSQSLLLGKGSFATVVEVRDKLTGAIRARKRQTLDEDRLPQILFEIKALTSLQGHRGIAELIDICHSEDRVDIIMPLYWGTLDDLMQAQGRTLSSSLAKNLTHQILVAVAFVHSKNLVHTDIKPDNILVTDDGILKLADFGLASDIGTAKISVGTFGYAAAESLLQCLNSSFQQDVWSTGAMFDGDTVVEAVTSILRFTGHEGGPLFPERLKLKDQPGVPKTWPIRSSDAAHRLRGTTPEAAAFITSMLQLQPNRRPHLSLLLKDLFFSPAPFQPKLPSRRAQL
ncbi:hypothetical protein V8E36_005197 [Tilletia maclaganii]